jgi:hypothetical protein
MDNTTATPGADPAQTPRKIAAAKTPSAPPPAAPVTVQVRALKSGLTIAGCRVAKGAVLYCTQQAAEFHEQRGEAAILGTA